MGDAQPIEILRAGTHRPIGGGRLSFSAADLAAAAGAYDPAVHERPIVRWPPRHKACRPMARPLAKRLPAAPRADAAGDRASCGRG